MSTTQVAMTQAAFLADPRAAMRDVMAGKTVTVTNVRGEPRMFILRQTEDLDDDGDA